MSLDAQHSYLTRFGEVRIDGNEVTVTGFEGENTSCRDVAALAIVHAIGVLQHELHLLLQKPGLSRTVVDYPHEDPMNAITETGIAAHRIPLRQIALSQTAVQSARRKHFAPAKITELAGSLKSIGQINPVLVRPIPFKDEDVHAFELVAGERRVLAAIEAGFTEIDATVRELTDDQVIEAQLVENLQREDVSPLEEAEGYAELMRLKDINAEAVGELVGKSRSWVYARLKLRTLAGEGREALASGRLDPSRALLVAQLPPGKAQERALKLATEMTWNNESPRLSYRGLKEEIARIGLTISLKGAPWALDDATFTRKIKLPGDKKASDQPLPACSVCPARSGNCTTDPTEDPDVCTDRACHAAKQEQHGERVKTAAVAAGKAVVDGEAAKKIAPRKDKLVGFYDLDDICEQAEYPEPRPQQQPGESDEAFEARDAEYDQRDSAWVRPTYRQLLGDDLATLEITLLEDPKTGRIRELVKDKALRALLAEKRQMKLPAYETAPEPKRAPSQPRESYQEQQKRWEEERKARDEREARERAYRVAVLKAIAEKCSGAIKREDVVDLVDVVFEHERRALKEVFKAAGIYTTVPEPAKLKDAELGRFVRLALVATDCWYVTNGPQSLLALAKRYKVDPLKIKAELAKAEKATTKPAAEKPAAKSAKKKGAKK